MAVARIKAGLQTELRLGNLDARRDWGYAGDYVQAMWLMLQQDEPRDYVIGSGGSPSVRAFCELAFGHVGLKYQDHVVVDPALYRPAEVEHLRADWSKAKAELGWMPTVAFQDLVKMMVDSDMARVEPARQSAWAP